MAGRNPVDPNETPDAKFVRLAEARTNKLLHEIKLIGNLASGQYARTPEQVTRMFDAIRAAVDSSESKYLGVTGDTRFTL